MFVGKLLHRTMHYTERKYSSEVCHPLGQNQKRTFLIECTEFAVVTAFGDHSNLGVTLQACGVAVLNCEEKRQCVGRLATTHRLHAKIMLELGEHKSHGQSNVQGVGFLSARCRLGIRAKKCYLCGSSGCVQYARDESNRLSTWPRELTALYRFTCDRRRASMTQYLGSRVDSKIRTFGN
ncbi:hypothetical protein C8R48DRAFT_763934 [Suillus tomentosus]|nr:hypothetical protein C8R48DRAFT_763934 [Suillus tomentosus]